MTDRVTNYLKKHSEALIKDVGYATACEVTGKSKATLGRYYSDASEHGTRFMPIDTAVQLEAVASYPHVTSAMAELNGISLSHDKPTQGPRSVGGVNSHVVELSQRFALLMAEYHQAIQDAKISNNEAKRLLHETVELQKVLVEIKLHLEAET